ncbi:hypothetical protein B9T31_13210 [Acinetobacter sp. ANC 4558]|uniref:acyltransferase domain-containing protein n=1 Tax=Acinetobacter sp. ANC 4558 TaxID=1977876 RepID=UPI000A32BCAC|nr:acyltransferase domain-containing protein [Acinetobacter sp. ANC 4558]OTG84115.1 hypothetical protein B9T31_13210 [Acinetobacter sp. ANC 4558]
MNFAILFSGQGLQTWKHIDELLTYSDDDEIRACLQQGLPEIFEKDLQQLDIYDNQFAQPFIFALQWCRWKNIKTIVDEVSTFSGYSLGELSALICSTETDLATGLALARERARLMSDVVSEQGSLVSVQGLNIEQLNELLTLTQTELSIKLNDSSCIVGGLSSNLQELKFRAKLAGAQIKTLSVSIPSHTSLMYSAVAPYRAFLNQQQFKSLSAPLISGTGGVKLYNQSQAIEMLSYQMDHAIDWNLCLESLKENLPDVVLEIGPGNVLSKMMLEIQQNVIARSVDDFKTINGLKEWLQRLLER